MAKAYIQAETLGAFALVADDKVVVERIFQIAEAGRVLCQAGIRYEVGIMDDWSGLPDKAKEKLALIWPPAVVEAAHDAAADALAEAEYQKQAAADLARATNFAEYEKVRLDAFSKALAALVEQRDAASNAGDKGAAAAMEAQRVELEALKGAGKTIEGQDPPAELLPPAPDASA
jgi:hypothetical protein